MNLSGCDYLFSFREQDWVELLRRVTPDLQDEFYRASTLVSILVPRVPHITHWEIVQLRQALLAEGWKDEIVQGVVFWRRPPAPDSTIGRLGQRLEMQQERPGGGAE